MDQQEQENAYSSKMKMTYSAMAVEAIMALAERHGSSLVAIRKYIQATYVLKEQQQASFNSLTLKGVNKAVALNELEKLKNSYKITDQEKQRRKERDRKTNYVSTGRQSKDSKVIDNLYRRKISACNDYVDC
jgi:hypothetical protein